ncbi:MAG: VWA domain-containing protein [Thalassolituus maritimus]|nr:MAG: VWA domain-containing protein [Thalassolituus maritimus]
MTIGDFVAKAAKPLPVIVLADVSGSMAQDGKIEALNDALKSMVSSFAEEGRLNAEIQLGLITFGMTVRDHLPLTPAHKIDGIQRLDANGPTPMGAAFDRVTQLLEDKEIIPSRAYRPVIILLSDGHPTDDMRGPFERLASSERASKATRLSLSIGSDANEAVLRDFSNDPEAPLFFAHDAKDIRNFFRAVTMSVCARSRSAKPNSPVKIEYRPGDDDDDLLELDL